MDEHQQQQQPQDPAAHLQAQINVLTGQIQVLLQQASQNTGVRGNPCKPQPYDADPKTSDWISFRYHFKKVATLNGWTDQTAKRVLAASMTGMAAMIIQDIDTESINFTTLDLLLDEYQKRFLPASASSKAQCDFETAQQESKEDVLVFHSRLRGLFRRAYPLDDTSTSVSLIRRFCRGVKGEDLQIWLFRQSPSTYEEALALAQADYAAKDMVRYNRASNLRSQGEAMDINAIIKCWNCDKTGHVSKECRSPKKNRNPPRALPARANPPRTKGNNSKPWTGNKKKTKWKKSLNALLERLEHEDDEEEYHRILSLALEEVEEDEEDPELEEENDHLDGQVESSSDFH